MAGRTRRGMDDRLQRTIVIGTGAVAACVYLSLVFAVRWFPEMKGPLQGVVVATLVVPPAAYLLSLPAVMASERFRRMSAPVFAFGLGLVIASLLALPFLVSPQP